MTERQYKEKFKSEDYEVKVERKDKDVPDNEVKEKCEIITED